jgi:SNF2 family DNA or RNA helicase
MTPWAHQANAIAQYALVPRWCHFWDPRTGKTLTTVHEMAVWMSACGVRHVLIVAPQSACPVWMEDDNLGLFDSSRVRVVDASAGPLTERAKTILDLRQADIPTILLVNQEALATLTPALLKWGPHAVVLDEAHAYKTPSAKRSMVARKLADKARFVRALTGTPDPRSYIDYYGIYKVVDPAVFGTVKTVFERRYVIYDRFVPQKIDRYLNEEELREKIFSRADRVRQEECFDMPDARDITIETPLPRVARRLYDELSKKHCAEFYGLEIDATHQLARLGIFQQLAAGFVRNEDGHAEWLHEAKVTAIMQQLEMLLRADKRVVVFYHYRPEGEKLAPLIRKELDPYLLELNGDTPRSHRYARPFAQKPKARVFLAQENAANLGLSLKEADHVLWTSWGDRPDVHKQARDRIFADRVEKPHGLTYAYLEAPNTVDWAFRASIARKQRISEVLLDVGFERTLKGAFHERFHP